MGHKLEFLDRWEMPSAGEGKAEKRDRGLKRLYGAILIEAIRDYINSPENSYRFITAQKYFFSSNTETPTSFLNVCKYLKHDPEQIKREIIRHRTSGKKIRIERHKE